MSEPKVSDGKKRLNLRKETLRKLSPKDLKSVVGGEHKELDLNGGGGNGGGGGGGG